MNSINRKWVALKGHWPEFCAKYPELGLSANLNGYVYFGRAYVAPLIEKDVVRKLPNGRMIADVDQFDAAAFDLLTKGVTA